MKKLFLILYFPIICFAQSENYIQFIPSSTSGEVYHHNFFSYSFSPENRLSEWTIYFATKEGLGNVPRSTNFRQDPFLNGRGATSKDYKFSGFDRGHLVPAADMSFSKVAMSECFYYSNMSPQYPGFNRGFNKHIENLIRGWIREHDSLVIITGCVFEDPTINIGNSVPVASFFYKIIIDIQKKSSIALLLPHNSIDDPDWNRYVCSISNLEKITGIDFFCNLSEDDECHFEDNGFCRCRGVTTRGIRCMNNTRNATGYCYIHKNQY